MAHFEKLRARRRRVTLTLAQRRRKTRVQLLRGSDWAAGYFAKQTNGCSCRKRRHGAPKIAAGMCCIDQRKRVMQWRQEARDLGSAALAGRDLDED